jgi:hypothetical protein
LSGVIYKATGTSPLPLSPVPFTDFRRISRTAGLKPAIAGGVVMAGVSTVWSFAKQKVLDIDL